MTVGYRPGPRHRGRRPRRSAGTAADILGGYLDAIAAGESDVHAFNHLMTDEAAAAAARVDDLVAAGQDPGPLAGVPVALKDNLCTRGVPTTCSSRILDGWRPPYDASVVVAPAPGRRRAGRQDQSRRVRHGVLDGELGLRPDPQPPGPEPGSGRLVGRERGRRRRRLQPVALGTDTGGSIRQPAAFCGVVGVKPTYGLVSRYGLIAFASSLDQIGPFATHRGRRRPAARCHRRSRPARLDLAQR